MWRDPNAFLWEVEDAAASIQAYTQGMDVDGYLGNSMVQAAVERKFEIIGEALNQLSKMDSTLASKIPDLPQIIAFRNQLIHGYATVNPRTVWNAVQVSLPVLLKTVQALRLP